MRLLATLLVLLLQIQNALSEPQQFEDRVGNVYEIQLESVTQTFRNNASSGNSRSATTLVERVIALRQDGVELEFDLPEGAPPEDRDSSWQLPARFLWTSERPLQLLNSSELEGRLQPWLQRAGLTEAACGRWIFTWTAIKIECDPQSALEMIEPFNLRLTNVHDGAPYSEAGARDSVSLRTTASGPDGQTLTAEMEVDPEVVRKKRAETDVVVAGITGREPLSLQAALQRWAARQISGTITITLETDSAGHVTKRTRVTTTLIANDDGSEERRTSTVTTQRRLVSP